MMKRTYLKIILMTIILFAFGGSISNATITANSQTVNSGENVVISVKSTQALGAYTVTVSDNGGLKFVTSSGQEGSGKTVISGSSTTGTTSLATFTFQAPSVSENKTYVVKINATGMETPNLESVENSSISVNVTVKAKNNSSDNRSDNNNNTSKSNNANLSNLIVSPVDFSGFKASKTSGYSVTVDYDVSSVKITAKTQDSKAKVSISGDKNLKVGSNEVKVTVTAEDGTKKVYKVSVIRKDKTTEETATTNNSNLTNENESNEKTTEVNTVPQVDDELGITSLSIVGISNNNIEVEPRIEPSFSKDIYEYATSVTSEIEKLQINAETNLSDAVVEIIGNEHLELGENVITILVKSSDGSKQQTYQIIVNKTGENLDLTHDSERDKRIIILAIVVIIVMAIIIATAIIIRKKHNKDVKRIGTTGLNYNVFEDKDYEKNKNATFNGKKVGKRFK